MWSVHGLVCMSAVSLALQDSVPHIALLGSGGGQRASVALMGALHQMGQDDLLDPLLYMGGVSGSSWYAGFSLVS